MFSLLSIRQGPFSLLSLGVRKGPFLPSFLITDRDISRILLRFSGPLYTNYWKKIKQVSSFISEDLWAGVGLEVQLQPGLFLPGRCLSLYPLLSILNWKQEDTTTTTTRQHNCSGFRGLEKVIEMMSDQ